MGKSLSKALADEVGPVLRVPRFDAIPRDSETTTEEAVHVNSLPTCVLKLIFSHFSKWQILTLQRVCTKWNDVVRQLVAENRVWAFKPDDSLRAFILNPDPNTPIPAPVFQFFGYFDHLDRWRNERRSLKSRIRQLDAEYRLSAFQTIAIENIHCDSLDLFRRAGLSTRFRKMSVARVDVRLFCTFACFSLKHFLKTAGKFPKVKLVEIKKIVIEELGTEVHFRGLELTVGRVSNDGIPWPYDYMADDYFWILFTVARSRNRVRLVCVDWSHTGDWVFGDLEIRELLMQEPTDRKKNIFEYALRPLIPSLLDAFTAPACGMKADIVWLFHKQKLLERLQKVVFKINDFVDQVHVQSPSGLMEILTDGNNLQRMEILKMNIQGSTVIQPHRLDSKPTASHPLIHLKILSIAGHIDFPHLLSIITRAPQLRVLVVKSHAFTDSRTGLLWLKRLIDAIGCLTELCRLTLKVPAPFGSLMIPQYDRMQLRDDLVDALENLGQLETLHLDLVYWMKNELNEDQMQRLKTALPRMARKLNSTGPRLLFMR